MSRHPIIYISVLFFIKFHSVKSFEPIKGPYRTIPVIIRNCTEKEVVHPHASFGQFIQWHAKIYNSSGKTFVRFNYTVLKPMETVKGKVRSSFWEDNQWKLRLLIPGFSCLRAITRNIAQALKFKINSKCTITEGSNTVDRFDYDALHQAWEPETEYGRWTWQYELTSKGKSLVCVTIESVDVPIRRGNGTITN